MSRKKPPLCKGRWPAGAEGLSEHPLSQPSADSSPYTGEPLCAKRRKSPLLRGGFMVVAIYSDQPNIGVYLLKIIQQQRRRSV